MEGGRMPEDYLGLGYVVEMSRYLKCKYEEVPPSHIHGQIQLMQGRYYCIYKHSTDSSQVVEGTLFIDKHGAHVEFDDKAFTFTFIEWFEKVKDLGFLVMPSVTRCGALVTYDNGAKVGCLVPHGTRAAMVENNVEIKDGSFVSNFDHINHRYNALVGEGTLLPMPVLVMLESLVPPGTILWIRPDAQVWEDLSENFPLTSLSEDDAKHRMIQVRLNIPMSTVRDFELLSVCVCVTFWRFCAQTPKPGIVYVTVMQCSAMDTRAIVYRHLEVDPWELTPMAPEEKYRIHALRI
jgi:hypothetical protein